MARRPTHEQGIRAGMGTVGSRVSASVSALVATLLNCTPAWYAVVSTHCV